MLIDHIGLTFFPQDIIFRMIGRISFPLFAWAIAQGAFFTHDIKKYAWRLFLFALISQYPFYLFGSIIPGGIAKLNVLFTLLFGLFAIKTYKSKSSLIFKISIFYLLFYFSVYFDMDYQIVGVLSVLFAYIFMNNFPALFMTQLVIFASPFLLVLFYNLLGIPAYASGYYALLAPFAFFLTKLKTIRPNPKYKYLLYWVYPVQFLVIYAIKRYIII